MGILGRERELGLLEEEYSKDGFKMTVVYGRRRVGKTKLLSEFVEGKKAVFFTAVQTGMSENLDFLSDAIFETFSGQSTGARFESFDAALAYISSMAGREPLVVVFDEYPYLAESEDGISSVLQRRIDSDWLHTNIHLILCGSQVSFMENEVLGEKSPLFGRRTSQMDITPFDYKRASLFFPNYSSYEKSVAYGITGGVAKYLSLIDPERSLYDNIKYLFFTESGYLYEEPVNILRQEFRSVQLYTSIISAIAHGSTQINQIATTVGMTTAGVSQALSKLISVRIVKKETPILNERKKKYIHYSLADGMFLFWYRFVAHSVGMIERGYGDKIFETRVTPYINEYMGSIFESMCREYTMESCASGRLPVLIDDIGWWIGHDNASREQRELDIVGIAGKSDAIVGECKFRNEPMKADVVERCIDSSRLLPVANINHYLMFSMGGFEQGLQKKYKSMPVKFYTLENLYM